MRFLGNNSATKAAYEIYYGLEDVKSIKNSAIRRQAVRESPDRFHKLPKLNDEPTFAMRENSTPSLFSNNRNQSYN